MPGKKAKSPAPKKVSSQKPFFYFWVGFFSFIAVCIVVYFTISYGNQHAIDVGVIASENTAARNAALLIADQVNAQGGVQVKGTYFPLRVTVVANGVTEEEIKETTQSLIDKGVLAIIGPSATKPAAIAKSVASSEDVLLLQPVCSDSCKKPMVMNAENEIFVTGYKKTYGSMPDEAAGAVYTVFQKIFAAIEQNGGFDRAGIMQAVE